MKKQSYIRALATLLLCTSWFTSSIITSAEILDIKPEFNMVGEPVDKHLSDIETNVSPVSQPSGIVLSNTGTSIISWAFADSNWNEIFGSSLHRGDDDYAEDWVRSSGQTAGQNVYAPISGTVVKSYFSTSSYGNTIVIYDSQTRFAFRGAHFHERNVSEGETVTAGVTIIGKVGSTCGNFGPHLHGVLYRNVAGTAGRPVSWVDIDDPNSPYRAPFDFTSGRVNTCSFGESTYLTPSGQPPVHPPGAVVKTANSQAVWLIDSDGYRRLISSVLLLRNLYNQPNSDFSNSIITVSQAELERYPVGSNITSALPSNGKSVPDGKLIKYGSEYAVVSGGGKRRPFARVNVFTGLGYKFDCNVTEVSQTEYLSYQQGAFVEAMPILTQSLQFNSSPPFNIGQTVTGWYTIANIGEESITFGKILIGGRLNDNCCTDFPVVSPLTLAPGQPWIYSRSFQFNNAGNYRFFAAYQEANGHWTTAIPTAPGVTGSVSITVGNPTPPPPGSNNHFANAQSVSGNFQVSGSNVGANKEPGERNHAGNVGGASVWYRWQAPANGTVTFRTANSNFDTLLAAYVGSSVSNLTLLAENDDIDGTFQSRITFPVTAGAVYHIVVDGYRSQNGNAATGNITLSGTSSQPRKVRSDFDGDGKADVAVFRPSNGTWYVLQSTLGFTAMQFGNSTDKPVPGDYDGDGKTDFAIYRSGNGMWYILRSSQGFTAMNFGIGTDIPVQGDYDGDGKTDLAVYRPSNGFWYVIRSSNGSFIGTQFGLSDDKPLPEDYDGDGKTDISVWRPSNQTWYTIQSSSGFRQNQFGVANDKFVPADYDGDRKADIAVFRSSVWIIQNSSNGQLITKQFGSNDDTPTPSDFDGDNRTDIAVFRPYSGVWYIDQSLLGFRTIPFGIFNDKPIPVFYIP